MYYYYSCGHVARPWGGREWINKCDETEYKNEEMRGLLNDSFNVSIDYKKSINDGSQILLIEYCTSDIQ